MNKKIIAVSILSIGLLAACGKGEDIAPAAPETNQSQDVVLNGNYENPALSIGGLSNSNNQSNLGNSGGTFFTMESSNSGASFNTNETVDSKAGQNLNNLNLTPEQLALLEQIQSVQAQEDGSSTQQGSANGLNTGLTNQVLSSYENSMLVNGNSQNVNGNSQNVNGMNQLADQQNTNTASMTQTTQQLLQQKLNELSGGNGSYQVGAGYEEEELDTTYPPSTLNHTIVNEVQAPLSLKSWINESKKTAGITGKELDGYYYILFSAGPKSESGFKLNLLGAYAGENGSPAEIHFNLTQNKVGRISMATYPIMLVKVLKSDVPNDVEFYGSVEKVSE